MQLKGASVTSYVLLAARRERAAWLWAGGEGVRLEAGPPERLRAQGFQGVDLLHLSL